MKESFSTNLIEESTSSDGVTSTEREVPLTPVPVPVLVLLCVVPPRAVLWSRPMATPPGMLNWAGAEPCVPEWE